MPPHAVHNLFHELGQAFPEPYPAGVVAVPEQIQGTSFFPGGTGLWVNGAAELPPIPVGGVMVLGHDFHSVAGYEWSKAREAENLRSPTWRHLLTLLKAADIPAERCFFTNIYMGLRSGKATTGPFPGAKSPEFVRRCRDFFLLQLAAQKPALILSLGANVPPFLSPLSPQLARWAAPSGFKQWDADGTSLVSEVSSGVPGHEPCAVAAVVHPSFRPVNVGRRKWGGLEGEEAEFALVRAAVARARTAVG